MNDPSFEPSPTCNICGSTEFIAGFQGRLTNGRPPMCAGCRTSERHRIIRTIYSAFRPLLPEWDVLQFAPDRSIDRGWFRSYSGSSYGGANSLDMMNTGLPEASLDLVMSNHVLEHVADDLAAIRESLRILRPDGVLHLCVPTPIYQWETEDWGFPDPKVNEHYRNYGADFGYNVCREIEGLHGVAVVGRDVATDLHDVIFFFSHDIAKLGVIANYLQRRAIPIIKLG